MKWYIVLIIGIVVGAGICWLLTMSDYLPTPYAEQNARLQDSLANERRIHDSIRLELQDSRRKFFEQVVKSKERVDSIERVGVQERAALIRELKYLKNRTVKELEDEAERAYRERLIALDTIR